jgi:glycosyltransferase involved in cell wall biosynthesis
MLYKLVQTLPPAAGFTHSVIALTERNEFDFAALDVPVATLAMRRGLPSPGALLWLRRMVSAARPDVVQGWMYHGNIAATLASTKRLPVVWGIHHALHDLRGEKPLTRALVRLGPLLSSRVRKIIYCARVSQHQHEALGYPAGKSLYIPNGFDCNRFKPDVDACGALRTELGLPADALLVGHAGRFHPVKNHAGLIAAFGAATKAHSEAWLLLAGAGVTPDNAQIMRMIEAAGIAGRVKLLGERKDMPRFFAALDVHVLASRSEGLPNVLGEAMACGVPCVTTDVGDSAAMVAETGKVVPPGGQQSLAVALEDMLRLPAHVRQSLGEQARSRIMAEYSLMAVAERYARLYRELTGRSR